MGQLGNDCALDLMDRLLGIMEIACTAGEGRKELPDALCTALILFLFQN